MQTTIIKNHPVGDKLNQLKELYDEYARNNTIRKNSKSGQHLYNDALKRFEKRKATENYVEIYNIIVQRKNKANFRDS